MTDMTKLIIFDLDGTLLDTLQDLTNSVNYAMRQLNLPLYSDAEVRSMIGNGVSVLMKRAVTVRHSELHEEALTLQRKYYSEHTDDCTQSYEGVIDMLASCKKQGFTVAVHSNKDEDYAKILCYKHFGMLVDYVLGTTDYAITKPNPVKILNLMKSLGVERRDAVYCGDSDVDLQTAFNAGIKCISVTWGFRDEQFLKDSGADNLAFAPQDVLAIAARLVSAE